ncbi:ribonuclease HI family protein [Candidatus Daviesbacteria bacterium]|nr:ribonuclease HI family protein [Candidatus Daviesbacteria bacterium]
MKIKIFTDGASRGNPGPASYGFVIMDGGNKLLYKEGKAIGKATNNVAEYAGVLAALKYAKKALSIKYQVSSIELYADSRLVVQQLSGKFKIKAQHLKPVIQESQLLAMDLGGVTYTHIPRSQNYLADSMANQALDNLSTLRQLADRSG